MTPCFPPLKFSTSAWWRSTPTIWKRRLPPFYFDARRGPNAHSRDVGFAPNDLGVTTIASPAVELLCLIGLQRVRPVSAGKPRLFDYHTWSLPLPPVLAPVAAAGLLPDAGAHGYRFESWFRTASENARLSSPQNQ